MQAAEWCGSYYSSDGQRFYARDAAALADALEWFLNGETPAAESPSASNPDRDRLCRFVSGLSRQLGVAPNVTGGLPPRSWPADDKGRQYLREFVEFCRRGSFRMG
jgi:hypothetical protein